jgi:formate hydrogenlyase subunit 6/NADH:ubiquinone oxidoreductase subunit I
MNILNLLFKNFISGSVTLRFPKRPPADLGYRGLVRYDEKLCTGCGVCAYRCTSRSIIFRPTRTAYTWSYDPGQCTFCGRCVDGCESHALTQDAECPPIYFKRDELNFSQTTQRPLPPPKAKPPVPPAPNVTATASSPGDAQ